MKEVALITGASSGIGYEFSQLLAEKGCDLIITARNTEKLSQLRKKLLKKYQVNVTVIPKDLSKVTSSKELYFEIKRQKLNVTILINNAGFGDYSEFSTSDIEKQLQMVQLNISSIISLTRYFIEDMKKANYGKILNVASTLAFFPMPLFSVYAATKSFVLSFSEAINEELKPTNISVTCLCPGPTKSNFTHNSEMGQCRAYKNLKQAEPKKVAKLGIKSMMKGKRTVIYGVTNKLLVFSTRLGTRGLVLKIAKFISGKQKKSYSKV